MLTHVTPTHKIIFGDQSCAGSYPVASFVRAKLSRTPAFFTQQIHSTRGVILTNTTLAQYTSNTIQADFIVTNMPNLALGVLTADCLPLIIYDSINHSIGIAHAGWAGTLGGIAERMFTAMHDNFGSSPDGVTIYYGPCASSRQYQVSADFKHKLVDCSFIEHVFFSRKDRYYFDIPAYNRLLLQQLGVPVQAFIDTYNECTIENLAYCSHRRNPSSLLRNITLAMLR